MEQEDKKAATKLYNDMMSICYEKTKEDAVKERIALLTALLRSARIEGRREMRDKIADMMLGIDNTYLGPEYREKLRDYLRTIEPEGI